MLDVNIAKKDIDDRVDAAKKLVRYVHMHSLCAGGVAKGV